MRNRQKNIYNSSNNIIISMPRIHEKDLVPSGFYWCQRCHWSWKPRTPRIPVACPDCMSRKWSGEKQQ